MRPTPTVGRGERETARSRPGAARCHPVPPILPIKVFDDQSASFDRDGPQQLAELGRVSALPAAHAVRPARGRAGRGTRGLSARRPGPADRPRRRGPARRHLPLRPGAALPAPDRTGARPGPAQGPLLLPLPAGLGPAGAGGRRGARGAGDPPRPRRPAAAPRPARAAPGLVETGHLAQNLLLTSAAYGLGTTPLGGLFDGLAHELLALDDLDEPIQYLLPPGRPAAP